MEEGRKEEVRREEKERRREWRSIQREEKKKRGIGKGGKGKERPLRWKTQSGKSLPLVRASSVSIWMGSLV